MQNVCAIFHGVSFMRNNKNTMMDVILLSYLAVIHRRVIYIWLQYFAVGFKCDMSVGYFLIAIHRNVFAMTVLVI